MLVVCVTPSWHLLPRTRTGVSTGGGDWHLDAITGAEFGCGHLPGVFGYHGRLSVCKDPFVHSQTASFLLELLFLSGAEPLYSMRAHGLPGSPPSG